MKKSTALFALLVTLVPAVLVYFAASFHAAHQQQLLEEQIRQEGQAAIDHILKVNELRRTLPGKSIAEIAALAYPPLPQGYMLRPLTAGERARYPALKDSDFLVQQTAPPYLSIPSAAPYLQLDITADSPPPTAPAAQSTAPAR
ncbi:hypothetical protein [Prosthecobacter fluviatilis]|uniref:Uncharacterized protein n=1 Tax=Prosthecobacter fluviatilis TaxID=445931 RepID=A0ABW0KY15_9BACT